MTLFFGFVEMMKNFCQVEITWKWSGLNRVQPKAVYPNPPPATTRNWPTKIQSHPK